MASLTLMMPASIGLRNYRAVFLMKPPRHIRLQDLIYIHQHTPQIVKENNETRHRKEIENMSKNTDELTAGMIVFHESPRHGSERTHKKRF